VEMNIMAEQKTTWDQAGGHDGAEDQGKAVMAEEHLDETSRVGDPSVDVDLGTYRATRLGSNQTWETGIETTRLGKAELGNFRTTWRT